MTATSDRACAMLPPVRGSLVHGAPLKEGQIYLAPGSVTHLEVISGKGGYTCSLRATDQVNGHRPSVDVLFNSVAHVAGARLAVASQ